MMMIDDDEYWECKDVKAGWQYMVDSIWLTHLLASRPVVREAADATSLEAVDT